MARLAKIKSEEKKIKTYERCKEKRLALKDEIRKLQIDPEANFEALEVAYAKLRKLPRNANPIRIRRRCRVTGRSRGYYKRVGLSKSMFRLYAMNGHIPGLVKASW